MNKISFGLEWNVLGINKFTEPKQITFKASSR